MKLLNFSPIRFMTQIWTKLKKVKLLTIFIWRRLNKKKKTKGDFRKCSQMQESLQLGNGTISTEY